MIYLDNNATTKIHPEVREVMINCINEEYGNPSSKYYDLAKSAKSILDIARLNVAKLVGCATDEVIFTSGSTESNNMIIKGLAECNPNKKHLITTKIEHPSVLNVFKYLETKGYDVTYLSVDQNGLINIEELKKSINSDTLLISVMWVNNEIGTINDISSIAKICDDKNIYFHVDATQAIGKINVHLPIGVTSISFSGHKIYGPKGIGVAVLRKDKDGVPVKMIPLFHGGEQEFGLRAGTQSVHNIAGLSKACEIVVRDFDENIMKLEKYETHIKGILMNKLGSNIVFNSPESNKVPGILNFRIVGVKNIIFLKQISNHIAASSGSACSITHMSDTLRAIGLSDEEIQESIRFSLSPYDNYDELERIL